MAGQCGQMKQSYRRNWRMKKSQVERNDLLARQAVGEAAVRSRLTVSKLQQVVALGVKLHRLLSTFIHSLIQYTLSVWSCDTNNLRGSDLGFYLLHQLKQES